jgi:transcription termination factor Rho
MQTPTESIHASSMLDNVTSTLRELRSLEELLAYAEELEIENASTMRKGDMMFEILRERADEGWEIAVMACSRSSRTGSVSCAAPRRITCPARTTSMSRPDMIRQHSLRTGDTVEGVIMAPRENERYFALTNVTKINFEEPTRANTRSPSTTSRRSIPMSA